MYRAEKIDTERGPTWMIERESLSTEDPKEVSGSDGSLGEPEPPLRGGSLPLPGLKHWRLRKRPRQKELALAQQADSHSRGRQDSSRGSSQDGTTEQDTPNGQPEKPASSKRGGAGKARKSQVDLLKTLAVEWRGENGVERLENRLGKPLEDMTRAEADEWIDRLTPKDASKDCRRLSVW
jgi:hypothetical protein